VSDPHRSGFAIHSDHVAAHPSVQRLNQIEMQLIEKIKDLPYTQKHIQTNIAGRQNLSLHLSALQSRKNQNGNNLYTRDRQKMEATITTHTHKKRKRAR